MKNQHKKRLRMALKLLSEIKGCPDDQDFIKRNECVFCEEPDYKKCWFDFINWKIKKG
jgi:hypothetical protein